MQPSLIPPYPGNAGNVLDGYNPPARQSISSTDSEGEDGDDGTEDPSHPEPAKWCSTTPPMRPTTRDKVCCVKTSSTHEVNG